MACSDDSSGDDESDSEGEQTTTGAIEINPDDWETFDFSEIALPYKTSAECIEHAKRERSDNTPTAACFCNSCLEARQECDALPGCVEIVQCSIKSNCRNSYDCYLLPFAPCTAIIDKWGNSSVATTISLELMNCSTANSCR